MLLAFVFALGLFFGRLLWKVPMVSAMVLRNRSGSEQEELPEHLREVAE
jgi:hypothetical protein